MPVLNGVKYACEPCMRGHRSSKCAHSDRILVQVRKPGRPLSSCPHPSGQCNCGGIRMAIPKATSCACGTGASNGTETTSGAVLSRTASSMSGVQKGHRRKSSTVSAAVLRGITQNDTSSFNLRQGPENPSGTGETSISRADEGARSYGVTDPQSSGPGSCCSSPPPRSSSGSISQATSHNLSNNGSQYANAKAEYDGQMRQRCNEGNGVVKNEVDESPPWLDNASGKGNGVPTSQSTERKPNSCCGSNLANSSAVSDTTAPGYTLEGLRRSALQSAPPVGSSNGNITSSGDAWASPMAGQLGMHATGLNYLSSPDLGLLGQTPATLSATPFMLPPGYETSQYPTVSENAAFSHQTPNLFAFSTPQQQSSPLDKSMHTPGWMSPSVAQSCGCGDACNCLGCATHPYNNRMIEYARHIRQLTEDDPLVWDNLSRPQSIVGQSSSDLTAFQPLDAVSYYTPPNAVGAEPMGDLGSGWQTEPLGATALTPQALDNVGHKAFSMSSDDLFTSTSTTNDPFLEQPSLSPAQFFQVDYMVASCSGEQSECNCGDGCACIGCTIHGPRNSIAGGQTPTNGESVKPQDPSQTQDRSHRTQSRSSTGNEETFLYKDSGHPSQSNVANGTPDASWPTSPGIGIT